MTVNDQKAKARFSNRMRNKKLRPLGTERGKILMAPDFDELPPEFLQAFYGGRLPEVEQSAQAPKRAIRQP